MKYKGTDISQWQEGLDYGKMAKSLDFVLLREGYRKTQDKMFIEHFSFRNFPQQTMKKSEINPTMNFMPIFSPFSDSEEINKFSKKLKEKSIELTNINTDTTEKIDKNENKNNNDILDEKQSTSKIIGVDESRNESIDIKNPVNSIKYNIDQIRKYINLIREQLEKERELEFELDLSSLCPIEYLSFLLIPYINY